MNLLSISTIRSEKKNAIADSANENNFGANSEFTKLNLKFQIICVELWECRPTAESTAFMLCDDIFDKIIVEKF